MHDFYLTPGPRTVPTIPQYFSRGAVEAYQRCPRQWWLTNGKYDGVPVEHCPGQVSPATLTGLVVHEVLQQWWLCFVEQGSPTFGSEDYRSVRKTFPVRTTMLQAFDELHRTLPARNPRVNADRLFGAFSIDDSIAAFKTLLQQTVAIAAEFTNGDPSPPQVRPELRITLDEPPLIGILDLVLSVGDRTSIIEYKTGTPRPSHKEQLQYYALLFYLKNGRAPTDLKLVYSTGGTETLPCPDPAYFASLKKQLGEAIARLATAGTNSVPPAFPSLEGCAGCNVRQFCSDYWESLHTFSLRMEGIGKPEIADTLGDGVVYIDAQVEIPRSWKVGAPIEVNNAGRRLMVTLPKRCLPPLGMNVLAVRILRGALHNTTTAPNLVITRASEVFWRSE